MENAPASAETIVQRQLDAYNARDLARFLAEYSDDIRAHRPPATEPFIVGKADFGRFYATQRFNVPGLSAELVHRIALGNTVIDHERIRGVGARPFEVAVVYEVVNGLIESTWSFAAG
jgi:hypothetical protein